MEKLKELGAENVSDLFMPDRKMDDTKKKSSDKIRFLFTCNEDKQALTLYNYFI